MQTSVRKWGNSPAIRLPASVMAGAKLRVDQAVELRVEDGRVIIEPVVNRPIAIGDIGFATGDDGFAAALAPTLGEWASVEDDAAWAGL